MMEAWGEAKMVTTESSIALPAELIARVEDRAAEKRCTASQLLQEALERDEAVDRLLANLVPHGDREAALDEFLMEYVVRMVHQGRAERTAERAGERKAS